MSLRCAFVALQNANVGSYKQEGFVEVLAASQTPRSTNWFQGTADAVRQYIWLFEDAMRSGVEDFLILSGTRLSPHASLHDIIEIEEPCLPILMLSNRQSPQMAVIQRRQSIY